MKKLTHKCNFWSSDHFLCNTCGCGWLDNCSFHRWFLNGGCDSTGFACATGCRWSCGASHNNRIDGRDWFAELCMELQDLLVLRATDMRSISICPCARDITELTSQLCSSTAKSRRCSCRAARCRTRRLGCGFLLFVFLTLQMLPVCLQKIHKHRFDTYVAYVCLIF